MRHIILIAHNLRSSHNVGSLLRTADGIGAECVYLTGYTPHPAVQHDPRLPHESLRVSKQISKTALGAEDTQRWEFATDVSTVITELQQRGYCVVALEQAKNSVELPTWQPPTKVAIVVGREVEGIEASVIAMCDTCVEIPMYGAKESYNVVQAAAMGLFHCRFSAV